MKKFCFVLCFILMIPMLLIGCKEDNTNDFISVQSITYSVCGEKTTLNSNWSFKTKGSSIVATTDEYKAHTNTYIWHPQYSSTADVQYLQPSFFYNQNINPNNEVPNFSSGDYLYYYNGDSFSQPFEDNTCRKVVVDYVDINYVQVRIIKDNLIELKSKTGQISQILCDSYQINYFI